MDGHLGVEDNLDQCNNHDSKMNDQKEYLQLINNNISEDKKFEMNGCSPIETSNNVLQNVDNQVHGEATHFNPVKETDIDEEIYANAHINENSMDDGGLSFSFTPRESITDDGEIKPMGSSEEASPAAKLDDEPLNFELPQIDPPNVDSKSPETTSNTPDEKSSDVKRSGSLKKDPKMKSFMDVLNDLYDDDIVIPEQNNLGPKPWLMKTKRKVQVRDKTPITSKLSSNSKKLPKEDIYNKIDKKPPNIPLPPPLPPANNVPQKTPEADESTAIDALPLTRKQHAEMYSLSKDLPSVQPPQAQTSLQEVPPEVPPFTKEAMQLVGDEEPILPPPPTPDQPGPSKQNKSVKKNKKKKPPADSVVDTQTVNDLAKAAMQALELSSSALLQLERKKEQKYHSYDDVATPVPPIRNESKREERSSNVYDDFAQDEPFARPASRRKVISVPQFQPVPKPPRNPGHVYDSTPLENTGINNKTMDMMYSLFGGDNDRDQYLRQVQEERNLRTPAMFSERAPSQAGSIYSEWSDCTVPDYPESIAGSIMNGYNYENNSRPNYQQNMGSYNRMGMQPNSGYQQGYTDTMQRPGMPSNIPPQFNPQHQQNRQRMPVIPINSRPTQPPPMFPLLGPNYEVHNVNSQNMSQNPHNQMPTNPYHQGQQPFSPNNSTVFGSQNMPQMGNWGNQGYPPPNVRGMPRHQTPSNYMGDTLDHSERGRSLGNHGNSRASSRGRSRGRSNSRTRHRRRDYSSDSSSDGYESLTQSDDYDTDKKAFLKGYKAAMRDAVLTFAEQQQLKQNPLKSALGLIQSRPPVKEVFEEDPREKLLRTLSNSQIKELAEDLELAAITKKALKKSHTRSRSNSVKRAPPVDIVEDVGDYEYIDDYNEQFEHSRAGRPLSRNGSIRSKGSRFNDDNESERSIVINRREKPRVGRNRDHSMSAEECDCSDCDERLMMEQTNHSHRTASPRSQSLRQRYLDAMEDGRDFNTRANVRARHGGGDPRLREQDMQRQRPMEFDDPNQFGGYSTDFRNSYPPIKQGVRFQY